METIMRCQNCDWTGDEGQLGELIDVFERVHPGDTMPDGECPKCGAVCFGDETPEERIRAAAPELLAALEAIVLSPHAVETKTYRQARAAIARARGTSGAGANERGKQ